ncbi:DUF5700 domain-containing putative Zn-dependent protease [Luteibacter aegosomatissinici]|uniref:DUF5700 domain-containing putative Zn-dependent protease n=1 Tax=Luteibacter aegosomatissinici TaxID=2911539 RepID=UPI001FF7189C|nr:DUF5700 domain-containing putative Zn-dependent protease [Luteibacter aegosomatissinici]UPG92616.1 hypothetical protein L2Y97_12120 [Luteibacter aegosomatissinici]
MTLDVRHIAVLLCFLLSFQASATVDVVIDTHAAHAVLDALQNPNLSLADAKRIAQLPANQGPIRKLREFKIDVTEDDLAHALFATAHGQPVTKKEEAAFLLDWMKPKIAGANALLAKIDADPAGFQGAIRKRIDAYTPPGTTVTLKGYVVAVGDGGGYAFGDTDFYLNLVMTDDFAMARSVTTHEMYHAVQGVFTASRIPKGQDEDASTACRAVRRLFDDVYREGTAVEVADVSLMAQFKSANSLRQKTDMDDGARHMAMSAALLEMSVVALEAKPAVAYDDVYDVGFFGHAVLYNISYAMARAIAQADGPAGLASFLNRPAYAFIQRYTELPSYGSDDQHPRLGAHTLAALRMESAGCP